MSNPDVIQFAYEIIKRLKFEQYVVFLLKNSHYLQNPAITKTEDKFFYISLAAERFILRYKTYIEEVRLIMFSKFSTILILSFLLSFCAVSQVYINISIDQPSELVVDAGVDTTININEGLQLGGDPTASGGKPNYTYKWSPISSASDEAIANPSVFPANTTIYNVFVTDENNCTNSDSIKITVKQIDGIIEINSSIDIDIYPNPNNGKFIITLTGHLVNKEIQVDIINSLGQIIYTEKEYSINNSIERKIELSNSPKGIYMLRCGMGNLYKTVKLIMW